MSSHDDPEERIRQLERSLSDKSAELTQSSAEAGQGQYGGYVGHYDNVPPPPPPRSYAPPPPPYGAPPPYGPFPTVQMSPSGGGRGWVVLAVMTVITVGIVASAMFFVSDVFSDVRSVIGIASTDPTVSGGGGPFGEPPSRSGANRPQITIAEPTVSSAPTGSDISVSGVSENKTIECNDANVTISGISNIVTLTGHCASVTISGIENVVAIDEADTISASGMSNRVTYRSGSPDIQNPGGSNTIEQG